MMIDYGNIALNILFTQNLLFVLTLAFGCDPKVFQNPKSAGYTGISLTMVLVILMPLSRVMDQLLTIAGLEIYSLMSHTLLGILGTYLLGKCLKRLSPDLWDILGEYILSLPFNGCILGVLFLAAQRNYNPDQALVMGFFAGLGVLISLISLVCIYRNCNQDLIPRAMRGFPLFFITAGLMSMAIVGYYGLHLP